MKFDVRDHRNKNWLWIRRELLRQHGDELGTRGVAVYAALASFAGAENTAYPSLSTIADMLGITRVTVRNAIKDLHRLGWIEYRERTGDDGRDTSHMFYLLECPVDNHLEGGGNSVTTAPQNNYHREVKRKEVGSNNSAGGREVSEAVEAYEEVFPRTLGAIVRDEVKRKVEDVDLWRAVLKWWKMNGHRARSVGKMLNKYRQTDSKDDLYRDGSNDNGEPARDDDGNVKINPRTGKPIQK